MHLDFVTSFLNIITAIIELLVVILDVFKKALCLNRKATAHFPVDPITDQVRSHEWLTAAP